MLRTIAHTGLQIPNKRMPDQWTCEPTCLMHLASWSTTRGLTNSYSRYPKSFLFAAGPQGTRGLQIHRAMGTAKQLLVLRAKGSKT